MSCIWKYTDFYRNQPFSRMEPLVSLIVSLFYNIPKFQNEYAKYVESHKGICDRIVDILNPYILNLSEIFSEQEIIFLLNNYRDIVEYGLNIYEIDSFSRQHGEYVQPRQLTRFCLEIAGFEAGSHIYNPFSGLASYPVMNVECKYEGYEYSEYCWALSQINLLVHGCDADIRCEDAFISLQDETKVYDGVIMTPPFASSMNRHIEVDAFKLALKNKLRDGGKMLVVLPLSFLFSKNDYSAELREKLIEDCYIDMVVTLPQVFHPFSGINTCVISIVKEKRESFLLFDGTSFYGEESGYLRKVLLVDKLLDAIKVVDPKYGIRINYCDFKANNTLMPNNYLQVSIPSDYPVENLGNLISSYRNIKGFNDIKDRHVIKYINTQDLSLNDIDYTIDIDKLSDDKLRRSYRVVEPNSLLLFPTEKGFRVGRIKEIPDETIISCSMNLITVRTVDDRVSIDYLFLQLISDYVKEQLSHSFLGASHGILPLQSLKDIKISVAPKEVQSQQLQFYYQENKSEAEKTIEVNLKKYESQVHLRKHAITQTLSVVSALWNKLNSFRNLHNGKLNDDDLVSEAYQMRVRDLFDSISNRLNTLAVQADNLANVEYNWGDTVRITPLDFVHDYINSHKDVRFLFIEENDCQNNYSDEKVAIMFSKKALEKVFDNIVSNAISYGFKDSKSGQNKIFITGFLEDVESYKIRISNNGSPIPDDIDTEDLFSYGFSTALSETDDNGHEHHGLGVFEVRNIMEEFGASVRIISSPENEYTVTYELTFKKISIEDE